MSVWSRISEALAALTSGESLTSVIDRLRTPPERSVAFTIAVIALGAKMAKADGLVTKDEVTAFRQVFHIAKRDEAKAAQVFNLARQDVAGYETYAKTVWSLFSNDQKVLENLVEGLFHIAMADGRYHPNEDDFVHRVAQMFDLSEAAFRSMRTRFVPDAPADAYDVLGVTPDTPLDEVRKVWRQKIRETHPDILISQGLPEEAITMATKKMIAINEAWEQVYESHTPA
ncbi:molecular chaperone DjlA [Amylibacter marinus]|uniref:Molecular chaperone DjlA n=1 Tax=Amylibacter marinus TaxID=1475483 RepID=A0ABQ5VU11_9RHOB|nr:molecular chaperone DjiA [Amylibacter marinus]GLQ34656.1 molecular chaperone DjlA [Amylibacter marinus]